MSDISLPWCEKFRPSTLNDLIIQPDLKKIAQNIIDKGSEALPNMLFVGSAGTGKTTLARIFASELGSPYLYINMSEEGNVDTMRTKVKSFASSASLDDKIKIVIGDEADGISKAGQDSFRALQESVHKTTRFIFTCNYPERISPAIKSRLKEIYFAPVEEKLIIRRVGEILKAESIVVPKEQMANIGKLIKKNYPDIRKIINHLQYFCSSGTLEINFDELQSEDVYQKFCDVVKAKKLSDVRELLKNNRVDYDGIMKQVFHSIINNQSPWELDENKKAEIIIQVNEYLYKSLNSVMDKEINFTAWSIDLMQTIGR
jgi:DNA polymerase III delta prime subunit